MKQPFTETIEKSELAIRTADDRAEVFNELLEGLGVGPVAGNILLDGLNADPQLMKQAEHELLEEVQRRRQQQHPLHVTNAEGSRRKRPVLVRGIVI
ncbi:LcrG family type III secretion system chaperone [Vibrio cortegadensis]|uniref:LcrG family type III secretion system chaperone n=1 Tax=Vibrio cortegadensis TaxID=1328770 RepID=A0ABV4MB68_9VIBR